MKNTRNLLSISTATLIFGTVISLAPAACFALDSNFMKDSAYRDFGEDDLAKVDHALIEALDAPFDNSSSSWQNETSGNSGEIIALSTFSHDAQSCREVKIINRSKRRLGRGIYNLCRNTKGGEWAVAQIAPSEATR